MESCFSCIALVVQIIICTSPISAWGLRLLPNFQKGGSLTESQILEGVAGKERCDLLQGEL